MNFDFKLQGDDGLSAHSLKWINTVCVCDISIIEVLYRLVSSKLAFVPVNQYTSCQLNPTKGTD